MGPDPDSDAEADPDPGGTVGRVVLVAGGLAVLSRGITLLVMGETRVTITPAAGAADVEAKPRYWLGEF